MKHFFLKTKHYNKCIYFTLKSYIVSKEFTYVNVFINLITASVFHIGCVAEWSKALIPMRSSRRGVGSNPIMAIYIFIFFFSLCFVFEKKMFHNSSGFKYRHHSQSAGYDVIWWMSLAPITALEFIATDWC